MNSLEGGEDDVSEKCNVILKDLANLYIFKKTQIQRLRVLLSEYLYPRTNSYKAARRSKSHHNTED